MKSNTPFNPQKYIIEKGKSLPYEKCLIRDDYEDRGLTQLLIVKRQPSGKFLIGTYLLDRLCLGLKNTYGKCNVTEDELEKVILKLGLEDETDSTYANNLVFGAIDYAEELGFKPQKDFAYTKYILNEELISDQIDEIEFGWNGKPLFINGPYDNTQLITKTLDRSVGAGNYEVLHLG